MTKVYKKSTHFTPPNLAPNLDKLAQLAQAPIDGHSKGVKNLQKKARSKFLTNALTVRLLAINSPLHKSYTNTLYCASTMVQKGKTLTSSYCGNRWCIQCNRIRTAKLLNGYFDALQALQDPQFVTLTIPNVSGDILRYTIEKMQYTAYSLIHKWQSRHKENKINGVRKIECTYNPSSHTFHPHFHIIVGKKEHAQYIVDQWLKAFPTAQKIAQDIRPCTSQQSILELFKYFTKVLTNKHEFYATQMDVIFQAMRRKRVYQPFGNIHPVIEAIEDIQAEEYENLVDDDRVWVWFEHDWVDEETGECLSGYKPSAPFNSLIDNILTKK